MHYTRVNTVIINSVDETRYLLNIVFDVILYLMVLHLV